MIEDHQTSPKMTQENLPRVVYVHRETLLASQTENYGYS